MHASSSSFSFVYSKFAFFYVCTYASRYCISIDISEDVFFLTWPNKITYMYRSQMYILISFVVYTQTHIRSFVPIVDAIEHKKRNPVCNERRRKKTLLILQHSPWNSIKFIFVSQCISCSGNSSRGNSGVGQRNRRIKKNSTLKEKRRKENERIKRAYTQYTVHTTHHASNSKTNDHRFRMWICMYFFSSSLFLVVELYTNIERRYPLLVLLALQMMFMLSSASSLHSHTC